MLQCGLLAYCAEPAEVANSCFYTSHYIEVAKIGTVAAEDRVPSTYRLYHEGYASAVAVLQLISCTQGFCISKHGYPGSSNELVFASCTPSTAAGHPEPAFPGEI